MTRRNFKLVDVTRASLLALGPEHLRPRELRKGCRGLGGYSFRGSIHGRLGRVLVLSRVGLPVFGEPSREAGSFRFWSYKGSPEFLVLLYDEAAPIGRRFHADGFFNFFVQVRVSKSHYLHM